MVALNPATTAAARAPRTWVLVVLLTVTATISYVARTNVSVAGALMMRELGFSQVQMGRVFSAFLLGYALFQVPAGWLADRLGAGRVLAAAALIWAVATVLTAGVAESLGWLLAVRFFLGVGEAPTYPAAAKLLSGAVPPASKARANGVVMASIGLGSAITPPFVTWVMIRWGWRAALLLTALPAVVIFLVWLRSRTPTPVRPVSLPRNALPPEPSTRAGFARVGVADGRASDAAHIQLGMHELLRSSSFLLLTCSYTLQGYVGYIFVFWFYLYLVEVRHFDLLRGAALSSLPWILSLIAIPAGGWISDALVLRWGRRWGRCAVPLAGFSLAGLLLAIGARAGNPYTAAVSLALSTACVLCVEGPFWATMMEICRARSGTGGGIMNTGSNAGGLISPMLTPWLAFHFGWVNALYLAAGLSVLAALLWLGVRPPDERRGWDAAA